MPTWATLHGRFREYGYAIAVTLIAAALTIALGGTTPSDDEVYALMALAVIVGLLLTVRLAPNRPPAAMVLLPAMVFDIRFGVAALPAVAYAAIVANLVRGVRGPRVLSNASHLVLAFALGHVATQLLPGVPSW